MNNNLNQLKAKCSPNQEIGQNHKVHIKISKNNNSKIFFGTKANEKIHEANNKNASVPYRSPSLIQQNTII